MITHQKSAPSPNWCSTEARDADEHAHNLRNWQQQYDQVSAGHFYGRIDEISLPRLQLFREHTSRAVHQQCQVKPNAIWLGFSNIDGDCRINGEALANDELMCRPGDCHFELMTPDDFDIYGLVVPLDTLNTTAKLQGIDIDEHALRSVRRHWRTEQRQHLCTLAMQALAPQTSITNTTLIEDQLLGIVVDLLESPQAPSSTLPSFARRKAVVEKVRSYIDAHPQDAISITALCELAHVSRRTLQYSFESVLGMSPLRYLRISRLNAVRRALLVADECEQSVAEIAQHWGFWHAGQFGKDYKELFGEAPSISLKRQL